MFDNIIDDEFTNACDTTVQGLWFGRKKSMTVNFALHSIHLTYFFAVSDHKDCFKQIM